LSLEAAFAVLGGWAILGESVTVRMLAGCALMLSGMILSSVRRSVGRPRVGEGCQRWNISLEKRFARRLAAYAKARPADKVETLDLGNLLPRDPKRACELIDRFLRALPVRFEVAGEIRLKSALRIEKSFLTIAGQTASVTLPAEEGILVKGSIIDPQTGKLPKEITDQGVWDAHAWLLAVGLQG
jgi:hypothetical protein